MAHIFLLLVGVSYSLCLSQIERDRLEAFPPCPLAPVVDLGPLRASEFPDQAGDGPVLGVTRKVAAAEGVWHTSRSGKRIWRLTVQSPGAAAIKLHIQSRIQHGRIFVYADEGEAKSVATSYSADGPFGDGDFWTVVEKGDRLTVEVAVDSEIPGQPIAVAEVAHFEPVRVSEVLRKTRAATPVCSPGDPGPMAQPWRFIAASVGLLLFQTENGTWTTCTGTLLNDREGTRAPMLLTAHQCISTAQRARSLQVYFRFDTSMAGFGGFNPLVDLPHGYRYQTAGARILASAPVGG